MDLKKSAEANVDNLRLPIIAIGFLFIGSLVLASFSYTAGVLKEDAGKKNQKAVAVNVEEEVKKEEEPEETPPPASIDVPPPVAEDIKIEDNKDDIPPPTAPTGPPPAPPGPKNEPPPPPPKEIIDFPDVEAEFPGGAAEMKRWINSNIEYPPMAIEQGAEGKVFVSFVVEPDGTITGISIERGVTAELDSEAKRMMRKMPKWAAGEKDGKKVRTKVRLPIAFTLN